MNNIYEIFKSLPIANEKDLNYLVEDVPGSPSGKIGKTAEGYPVFFVECQGGSSLTNINLQKLSVNFDQLCNLFNTEGQGLSKKYTIILLKSAEEDIQKYFLELMGIILQKIPVQPSTNELKKELNKVISLFTAPPSFSPEIVKGLWAELFVISKGSDPDYLINAWHVCPEDKYDYNDGIDKIEVKATNSTDRVHTFSIEQLNPNQGSQLAIASVIVISSGLGVTVFDLIDMISLKVKDIVNMLKVKEIVYTTLGIHTEESRKMKYDFSMAQNSYQLYDYKKIPSIPIESIPIEVNNVHFSSCIKDVTPVDYSTSDSKLLKSL